MPVEKWSDDVVVVHLSDDPQFTDDLEALDRPAVLNGSHAVLDFGGVRFINSTNLARLLKLRKQMQGQDRRLVLCNINTQLWGIFLTTGLDKVFQLSDNVTTALATLQIAQRPPATR